MPVKSKSKTPRKARTSLARVGINIQPNKPQKPVKYGQPFKDVIDFLRKNQGKIGHLVLSAEARDGCKLPGSHKGEQVDGFTWVGTGWKLITEVEREMIRRLVRLYLPDACR